MFLRAVLELQYEEHLFAAISKQIYRHLVAMEIRDDDILGKRKSLRIKKYDYHNCVLRFD